MVTIFNLKDKTKNKTERIVMRVSKEEKDYLTEYCKSKDISLTQYVYNLIAIDLTKEK